MDSSLSLRCGWTLFFDIDQSIVKPNVKSDQRSEILVFDSNERRMPPCNL